MQGPICRSQVYGCEYWPGNIPAGLCRGECAQIDGIFPGKAEGRGCIAAGMGGWMQDGGMRVLPGKSEYSCGSMQGDIGRISRESWE